MAGENIDAGFAERRVNLPGSLTHEFNHAGLSAQALAPSK
jgi:hypothetical protein